MQDFGQLTLKIAHIGLTKVMHLWSIFHFSYSNGVNLHGYKL